MGNYSTIMRLVRQVAGSRGSLKVYDRPDLDCYVEVVERHKDGGHLIDLRRYPRTAVELRDLNRYADEVADEVQAAGDRRGVVLGMRQRAMPERLQARINGQTNVWQRLTADLAPLRDDPGEEPDPAP
jgi:hypothetical protein